MLSNFRIVLVETSHPGNIGAAARAMKNMQIHHLWLVAPRRFPCADATARAAGANDILSNLVICNTLLEALADCHIVIGASARDRTIRWPELTVRECAEKFVLPEYKKNQIAIVFGRENSGLKNHELDCCQYLLRIPGNPEFSSLNVAAAVQLVCYELFVAASSRQNCLPVDNNNLQPVTSEQMEMFYQHLYQTLDDIGFLHVDKSQSIMRRLRRIFNRIQLDVKELDILRGILRFSQNHNNR